LRHPITAFTLSFTKLLNPPPFIDFFRHQVLPLCRFFVPRTTDTRPDTITSDHDIDGLVSFLSRLSCPFGSECSNSRSEGQNRHEDDDLSIRKGRRLPQNTKVQDVFSPLPEATVTSSRVTRNEVFSRAFLPFFPKFFSSFSEGALVSGCLEGKGTCKGSFFVQFRTIEANAFYFQPLVTSTFYTSSILMSPCMSLFLRANPSFPLLDDCRRPRLFFYVSSSLEVSALLRKFL